jgi:cysteine synthase A
MVAANESGSMVLLAGDSGERYLDTYCDDRWVVSQGHDLASHLHVIQMVCDTGVWCR